MEKERDRERLEARRRLEQQKRGNEEEQAEVRRKVTELQSDLLELRDAHAKLRTSCEKLRRDKERVERERDEAKKTATEARKADNESEKRVVQLLAEVQKMKDLCPLVLGESLRGELPPETSRRGAGNSVFSSSHLLHSLPFKTAFVYHYYSFTDKDTRAEKVRDEFMNSLRQINQYGEDIKRLQQRDGEDGSKRTAAFRRYELNYFAISLIISVMFSLRAMSNAPEELSSRSGSSTNGSSAAVSAKRTQPAYRRSLSLEQRQNMKDNEVVISLLFIFTTLTKIHVLLLHRGPVIMTTPLHTPLITGVGRVNGILA